MPVLRRIRSRTAGGWLVTSSPSMKICPLSGVSRPRMHFSITDLPVPEPPMTTSDSPGAIERLRLSRITFLPNDLQTLRSSIFGVSLMRLFDQQDGEEIVADEDQHEGGDDGIGCRLAHPLRAAGGMEAVIAAHQGDDKAEDAGLDQSRHDVAEFEEIEGILEVVADIEAELLRRPQIAARDADDIGEQDEDRQRDDAGNQPRRDEIFERVG